ncbi:hypothetical protein AcV5_000393 [Taiwanofungus camphoratus]|nr:hypothetical protein AcV5_000393 [Antrodia cinnamomea]
MSFANLRSQRQSKQSRSFVQSSPAVASDIATSSAQPADNIDASTVCAGSVEVVHIDGLHKVLPAFLEIRRGESGRGIYCRKQSKAGTVLMSIRPHVSVLSTSYLDSYCSFCCGPSSAEGLKRCTRCRVFWYCGVTCQNNDWPLHKCECVALQQWASSAPSPDLSVPGDAIRCLGRLLWSRQKEGLGSTWAREISMMQSRAHICFKCNCNISLSARQVFFTRFGVRVTHTSGAFTGSLPGNILAFGT